MRTYKRKTARRGSRDKRMATVARLHADGISNREIARMLSVAEGTVRNDLQRWAQERPNVTPLVRNSSAQSCPPGGEVTHQDYAPDNKIIPFRRSS